jgi:hypothetical protein
MICLDDEASIEMPSWMGPSSFDGYVFRIWQHSTLVDAIISRNDADLAVWKPSSIPEYPVRNPGRWGQIIQAKAVELIGLAAVRMRNLDRLSLIPLSTIVFWFSQDHDAFAVIPHILDEMTMKTFRSILF